MKRTRFNNLSQLHAILLFFTFLISACGGSDSIPPALDESLPSESDTAVATTGDEGNTAGEETGMDISGMVNQELPPGFPADFPIPAKAQVSSTISLGADDEFRVYFAQIDTLEQTIAFFDAELPHAAWTIVEQKESPSGYEFEIENPTYAGKLLLIGAETGVAIDVHLMPLDTPEMPVEIDGMLGDTTTLGDTGSGLPSDLPVPTSFNAVDVPAVLSAEGYVAAFQFDGIAEMALVDFNVAMFTSGWLVEDAEEGDLPRSFDILFSNPNAGFQGYALVTDNLAQLGITGIEGTLIALHEGVP